MRLRKITVGAVLCMALFVAAPAYGQSSAQNGYSQPAGSVQQTLENKSNDGHRVQAVAQEETSSDSKLPFTGLDIALVIACGALLLALGVSLRRLGAQA